MQLSDDEEKRSNSTCICLHINTGLLSFTADSRDSQPKPTSDFSHREMKSPRMTNKCLQILTIIYKPVLPNQHTKVLSSSKLSLTDCSKTAIFKYKLWKSDMLTSKPPHPVLYILPLEILGL